MRSKEILSRVSYSAAIWRMNAAQPHISPAEARPFTPSMYPIMLVLGALLIGVMPASAQSYTFTTLAGISSRGHVDGTGDAARFNFPADVAVDSFGNLFVADRLNHTIRKVTEDGIVTTLAGAAGQPGSADGSGEAARFSYPSSIAVDGAGTVYVGEHNTIRKVSPAGEVTTLAGSAGKTGSTDGAGSAARFSDSINIAVNRDGVVYVADAMNFTIRRITAEGIVSTVAGSAGLQRWRDGLAGAAGFSYMGRLAVDPAGNLLVWEWEGRIRKVSPSGVVTTWDWSSIRPASFDGSEYIGLSLRGLAVDQEGTIYASFADDWNSEEGGVIVRVTPSGAVMTLAGSELESGSADGKGSEARFAIPAGLAVDGGRNVFVADSGNNTIRKITSDGIVTTIAGTPPGNVDGTGGGARFRSPFGLAVDNTGNVYVGDNNRSLRKITTEGVVTTLVSSPLSGGTATVPPFSHIGSVAVDEAGTLYFVDPNPQAVRKVAPTGAVTTLATFAPRIESNGSHYPPGPSGVAVDRGKNVYVALGDDTIRKVTPAGVVTTLAGSPWQSGSVDGIGSQARFSFPRAIALNSVGTVYVADSNNHTIRRITADGVVTTVAGTAGEPGSMDGIGSAARFNYPRSIAIDSAGSLFVLDADKIRKITDGIVTTLSATPGSIGYFYHIAVDAAGNLYVTSPDHIVAKGGPIFTSDTDSQLVNVSVRATLLGQQPLIASFDLRGTDNAVLLRGIGPGLQPFLPGTPVTGNPRLDLFDSYGARLGSNESWGGGSALSDTFAHAGAFPLASGSTDAALVRTVSGRNTVHFSSATNGIGLLEVFDVSFAKPSGIIHLSARQVLAAGTDPALVVGFTINGRMARTVLIRGLGPGLGLAAATVGALTDPRLNVFRQDGQEFARNDDWPSVLTSVFTRVAAPPLAAGSKDAALLLTLRPGAYTAVLNGAGGGSGEAMIEIYDAP
jgi:sugar lactone lactonase YvrE